MSLFYATKLSHQISEASGKKYPFFRECLKCIFEKSKAKKTNENYKFTRSPEPYPTPTPWQNRGWERLARSDMRRRNMFRRHVEFVESAHMLIRVPSQHPFFVEMFSWKQEKTSGRTKMSRWTDLWRRCFFCRTVHLIVHIVVFWCDSAIFVSQQTQCCCPSVKRAAAKDLWCNICYKSFWAEIEGKLYRGWLVLNQVQCYCFTNVFLICVSRVFASFKPFCFVFNTKDIELSKALEESLKPYGVFETEEELQHRCVYFSNNYLVCIWF